MGKAVKTVIMLIILLFASSIIMGAAFARLSNGDLIDDAKNIALEESGEILRLRAEIEFNKLVAESLKAKNLQQAEEFELRNRELEIELFYRVTELEEKIDELKDRGTVIIYSDGGY